MPAHPWSWESKRWTLLASLVVLAGLYAVMWYLMGGCELTLPGLTDDADPAGAPSDAALEVIEAMTDANVVELALHVAWFHTRHGRLAADFEELGKADRPPDGPPPRAPTADGQAIAYRPTGERTYELALAGADETQAALPLAQLAEAGAQVALDASVLGLVPVLRRNDVAGRHGGHHHLR